MNYRKTNYLKIRIFKTTVSRSYECFIQLNALSERYFQTKIQASNSLEDNLSEDEPNKEYYKKLADERKNALMDALEENRCLYELLQGNADSIIFI